ncbi:MAG: hypothetical protein E6K50_10685 [Gammaproteobacteria bacterium]|nr:MAG: hypothetical protein E6K50_10685 [Gammaproteobacteria bacterium]
MPSSPLSSWTSCARAPRSSRRSRPRSRAASPSWGAKSLRRQCPLAKRPDILAVSHTRGPTLPGVSFEETALSVHSKKKARTRRRRAAPEPRTSAGAREASAAAGAAKACLKAQIQRHLRAQLAALTGGLAPDDYLNAWWEWYLKLATQPPRQVQLARRRATRSCRA